VNSGTTHRLIGVVALTAALAGCSSSSSSPSAGTTTPPAADAAASYLGAVNALCDALLPKIVKATHGGRIDVPARQYLATWPAHKRLLNGFDTSLAAIPVPSAAREEAAALTAYVRFADRLDAARLKAARSSQAAYAAEVRSEDGAASDPRISALTAAGFNQSCTAR
jgi:hypothetical protein